MIFFNEVEAKPNIPIFQYSNCERSELSSSDYVLDETITLLFRRPPFKTAKGSLAKIDKAIKEGYLQVEWVTPERFEKAKGLRLKYELNREDIRAALLYARASLDNTEVKVVGYA